MAEAPTSPMNTHSIDPEILLREKKAAEEAQRMLESPVAEMASGTSSAASGVATAIAAGVGAAVGKWGFKGKTAVGAIAGGALMTAWNVIGGVLQVRRGSVEYAKAHASPHAEDASPPPTKPEAAPEAESTQFREQIEQKRAAQQAAGQSR